MVYTVPDTDIAVVGSSSLSGSLKEMLTIISKISTYSTGRVCAISQLQLRLTLVPIGWIGLG